MKIKKTILFLAVALLLANCDDILDKKPLDKLSAEQLFGDPAGVKLYMANLYGQLPVEDFGYFRTGPLSNDDNGARGIPNNGGFVSAMLTDEAVHSEWGDFMRNEDFRWWSESYKLIRDVNILLDAIPTLNVPQEEKDRIRGEAAFIRAYTYFELAKLYGGVPLILATQEYTGIADNLKVPRNTEAETWDFIMEECDVAINTLPVSWSGGERRATRWAAYGLKSRASLHAASIAKFGNKAPLSGTAFDQGLIGLEASLANGYYQSCIDASAAIINAGVFSLYKANPASPQEAAENYRQMFEDPNIAASEAIFIKGYAMQGNKLGHNYAIWFGPAQTANGWPHPGRMNPTLDLIDLYESYDSPGVSEPVVTTQDGDLDDYNGFSAAKNYLRFDTPFEIFEGKDARFWGTVIVPGTTWKENQIIIQAGYVKPNGEAVIRSKDQIDVNGKTYYSYGAQNTNQYSGFDPAGGNNTRTGFSFKKFLDQRTATPNGWNLATNDFVDMRYGEILLNYAEAVVESGLGDVTMATNGLNDIRTRAGHTQAIALTVDNVQRERRIELAFENKRFWDLIRRRDYHILFNNRRMHSLLPLLDLRVDPPKYIFVRAFTPNLEPRTFEPKFYYRPIPDVGANGAVQNPQY
jgi:hypothetical protein